MALARAPDDHPPLPDEDLAPADAAAVFARAGFLQPERARVHWSEMLKLLPPGSPFRASIPAVWHTLGRTSDADLALRSLSRFVEADVADATAGLGEPRARRWEGSEAFREAFVLLSGTSPALAAELERSWREFEPERWQKGWETPASLSGRLRPLLDLPIPASSSAPDEFSAALRRFRRVEDLRIAYLDECRRLAVDAVTVQISWLADALIDVALARSREETARRLHLPALPVGEPGRGFAVLALGKLGSLELNYSSDIDLLFLTDDSGPEGATPELREVFHARLAERLIHLMDGFNEEGRLYRIDTRLRPGGSADRLAWPIGAALAYYHSQGRTWERQALIRLRPVAGDLALASSFRDQLDPFIFRRTLSSEEIAELQGLKTQLERLAAERGESETHVKIGRGGIRDVEYIVQYLQLLHGASLPELKEANVFRVLEALEKARLLNADETDSLRRGYRFLRQVEHRIQLNYLRQTHKLPDDPADLRRIARGLGFEGSESFRSRFNAHSARIRMVYRRLFESAAPPREEEERLAALLELPLPTVAAAGREFLEPYGFTDPDAALGRLRRLAGEEGSPWDVGGARGAFKALAPRLLRELSQYPDPDRTLANFHECVSTLGARSAFFSMLLESEAALNLVLEISGRSTYAIEVLRGYPSLFDEVIDALRTGYGLDRESLLAEAERLAREAEDPAQALFEFKYLHFLLTAFRDLDRSLNLTSSMRQLSHVADAVLRAALDLSRGGTELAVLALGKLGGEELNYRSDLDLVFLYRPPTGGEAVEAALAQERAHLLAQGVLNRLGARDQLGPLFKVDVRLRPMGSKNLLAVSFEEFRRYFESGTAQTWERQAFLRARAVAGSEDLGRRALAFIHGQMPLHPDEDPAMVRREVAAMRRRIEDAAGPADFIKRGRGGIVDVEFVAQALMLIHGRAHPEVIAANTPQALDRLARTGVIAPAAAADLLTSYQFLRWLETRLSLVMAPEESLRGMHRDRLRSLIHRIGYRSTGEVAAEDIFEEELAYYRRRNREHLERVLETRV